MKGKVMRLLISLVLIVVLLLLLAKFIAFTWKFLLVIGIATAIIMYFWPSIKKLLK